jgi:hypothetical protein
MHINEIVSGGTRIVEVGAVRSRLPRALERCGLERLLEVTFDESTRAELREQCPTLADRIVAMPVRRAARSNNAQLLVLGPRALTSLLNFRSLRHAESIGWESDSRLFTLFAEVVGRYRVLRGQLGEGVVVGTELDKIPGPLLKVYPVRKRQAPGVRRYIPHCLGVEGFLREISARGIKHAVLRWFEGLPHVAPGEDIDLLVADEHLEQVRDLLDSGPGIQPIDLYSASGLPGSDYRSLPYFPPYLATALLDQAVEYRELCRVPAPSDHFRSMVYHALYHKGFSAGLASQWRHWPVWGRPEHDYPAILAEMATSLGEAMPITMEDLDTWLDSQAWRPPHDMLVRLAKKNRWLARQLADGQQEAFDDQIAVFLLRREAMSRGGIDRAVGLLRYEGFHLLATHKFPADQVDSFARTLRGGNWGAGPWPLSGGPPVAAIVVFDPQPLELTRRERRKYPFVASQRILCKERLREQFNRGYPDSEQCNAIHSSDNGREAYDYLRVVMPERIDEIVADAARLRDERARRAA